MKTPFAVNISRIHGLAGNRMDVSVDGEMSELFVSGSAIGPGENVSFDGTLELIEGPAIVAEGFVKGQWSGECRRCLGTATGRIEERVREIYENEPTEGETYLLKMDQLDLEPMIREVIMLELPEAPLCRPDCAGLCSVCGINRNKEKCDCSEAIIDQRWAALDVLRDDKE